jgi:predicted RNA-binding protein YlqC (UPF0109 family)
MKELLTYILTHAVPEVADEVVVRQSENELGITLEIEIPSSARGKIIGRNGQNIKAIHEVLGIMAQRQKKRVFVKVLD